MKSGFILKDSDSAPATFYAPGAADRHVTPAQAWSDDPAKALCFASKGDAETFTRVFLPQFAAHIDYVPYTEPA